MRIFGETSASVALAAGILSMAACSDSEKSVVSPQPITVISGNENGSGNVDSDETPDYGPGVPWGPDESIFERDHVVEVRVQIAEADWEVLRREGMSIGEVSFPTGDYENGVRVVPEYTEFSAVVSVDGIDHENVVIKKKGYIGSLSASRPSLKFNFSKNFDEPLAAGMKRLTLNNDRQDPSHVRQCMAYDLFAKLGLPSPRCNFAHVVVNGKDLGIYTNLEPIKKPMLARFFDDTDGNLYEGEISDFNPETVDRLELKTNKTENDRSDLQPVLDALALDDDQVVDALSAVVDLDSFFTFWALETLIGHWDGYASSRNNYRAYHDPTTDRFYFIPWGMDQAFEGPSPNSGNPYLSTVYADGVISRRLYDLPEQRERYRTRLAELVEEVWDVPALLEQTEQLQLLAWDAVATNVEEQRSYIRERGVTLLADLQEPAPEWIPKAPRTPAIDECVGTALQFSATFSTTWTNDPTNVTGGLATVSPDSQGRFDLEGEQLGGQVFSFARPFLSDNSVALQHKAFLQMEATDENGLLWYLVMQLPREYISPGSHPFHGLDSGGSLRMFDATTGFDPRIAVIGGGEVIFDEAGLLEGSRISGRVEATAYLAGCVSTWLARSEDIRVEAAAIQAEEEAAAAAAAAGGNETAPEGDEPADEEDAEADSEETAAEDADSEDADDDAAE